MEQPGLTITKTDCDSDCDRDKSSGKQQIRDFRNRADGQKFNSSHGFDEREISCW
jgi:hypothetical protein